MFNKKKKTFGCKIFSQAVPPKTRTFFSWILFVSQRAQNQYYILIVFLRLKRKSPKIFATDYYLTLNSQTRFHRKPEKNANQHWPSKTLPGNAETKNLSCSIRKNEQPPGKCFKISPSRIISTQYENILV